MPEKTATTTAPPADADDAADRLLDTWLAYQLGDVLPGPGARAVNEAIEWAIAHLRISGKGDRHDA